MVRITVNGVSVECELSEVAAITAALSGSDQAREGDSRPGERRRENPSDGTTQSRVQEFRRIRAQYTDVPVETHAGKLVKGDIRRRSAEA